MVLAGRVRLLMLVVVVEEKEEMARVLFVLAVVLIEEEAEAAVCLAKGRVPGAVVLPDRARSSFGFWVLCVVWW